MGHTRQRKQPRDDGLELVCCTCAATTVRVITGRHLDGYFPKPNTMRRKIATSPPGFSWQAVFTLASIPPADSAPTILLCRSCATFLERSTESAYTDAAMIPSPYAIV